MSISELNKRDIESSADLKLLVQSFYTKVLQDDLLADIFIRQDFELDVHLPVMISFWESILLDKPAYSGNAVRKHQSIHQTTPILCGHFERWLELWQQTVESLFIGGKALEAVSRAKSIALILQAKLSAG